MRTITYLTGDTHGNIHIGKLSTNRFPLQKQLTKQDFAIVCGDFGVIWDDSNEQKYWLKWLENKSFTTLFVDGNHEGFDILDSYPVELWNGGKIHRVSKSVIHLMRGQVFTIDGYKFFTMGGANSIDKAYRRPHISWWPQEMPSNAEYEEGMQNLAQHGNKVDLILTHTAPLSIIRNFYEPKDELPINRYLETVKNTVTFQKWYFGHVHEDKEIEGAFGALYHDIIPISDKNS